ncbi:MAG: carbamoyl-phosphate synthase large subunit, partial [Nitrososphaerota archaeon]
AMVIPPVSLSQRAVERIKEYTRRIALELKVVGLLNVQFAVMGDEVYVLEVNARASRTVPFLSKVINVPMAKVATKLMLGKKLRELGLTSEVTPRFVAVKESVFSFAKLPGVDPVLEPRMKSTGECMGIGRCFEEAYWKAELGANNPIPAEGRVLMAADGSSVEEARYVISQLKSLGFEVLLLSEVEGDVGGLPDIADRILEASSWRDEVDAAVALRSERVKMVVDLRRKAGRSDLTGYRLRRGAVITGIPYVTTYQGVSAAIRVVRWIRSSSPEFRSLNELHSVAPERPAVGNSGVGATGLDDA